MGEVHIQSQQEPMVARPIIMGQIQKHKQQPPIIFSNSPMGCDLSQKEQEEAIGTTTTDNHHSVVDPTDLLSMLHLSSSNGRRHQPPCTAANNNSAKRPSPSSSGERSAKKLFCDQEDLTLHGFSAISLPLSLGTLCSNRPVFRRCVSDPYNPPAPEHATPPMMRGSGLPPLHPSLRRSVSDLTPSPAKASSRSLSSEETTPDSMRLRRMKDRLREMRQWWDEVMKDEEEGEEECTVAENDEVPSEDELGENSEEAVSVEWADKCVSLTFRCPCGKGYEVLISANNCYYKLV